MCIIEGQYTYKYTSTSWGTSHHIHITCTICAPTAYRQIFDFMERENLNVSRKLQIVPNICVFGDKDERSQHRGELIVNSKSMTTIKSKFYCMLSRYINQLSH